MKKTYWEKLRDPRWQKRRQEIMNRDRYTCVQCKDSESTLNVHHRYYVSKRDPWDYPDWCLQTLCEQCHEDTHNPIPDGDGNIPFDEWEIEMDWITLGGGHHDFIGWFWYAAAAIHRARKFGVDDKVLIKRLEQACEHAQEEKRLVDGPMTLNDL